MSDLVIMVLDARDPLGSRCLEVEDMVLESVCADGETPKRLMFVLNKIDLVPGEVARQWCDILNLEIPTVGVKSGTFDDIKLLRGTARDVDPNLPRVARGTVIIPSKSLIGYDELQAVLSQFTRLVDCKKTVVGVIGLPNVGKSSVINSLKRAMTVGVNNIPGCTTEIAKVKLDKTLDLIDSPGVLFDGDDTPFLVEGQNPELQKDEEEALANLDVIVPLLMKACIRVDAIHQPIQTVHNVVGRCNKEELMQTYRIGSFDNADEFISLVAQKRSKVGKGGVLLLRDAAKSIIRDWTEGVISFYCEAPAEALAMLQPKKNVTKKKVKGKKASEEEDIVDEFEYPEQYWGQEFQLHAMLEDCNRLSCKYLGMWRVFCFLSCFVAVCCISSPFTSLSWSFFFIWLSGGKDSSFLKMESSNVLSLSPGFERFDEEMDASDEEEVEEEEESDGEAPELVPMKAPTTKKGAKAAKATAEEAKPAPVQKITKAAGKKRKHDEEGAEEVDEGAYNFSAF